MVAAPILFSLFPAAAVALPLPAKLMGRSPRWMGRVEGRGLVNIGEGSTIVMRQTSVDVSLVPQFGVVANTNPDGTGNCEGANGVAVPCNCPPDRQTFINDLIDNVNAGAAVNNSAVTGVTFPSGTDVASAQARFNAATITLQNLQGAGVGCPQAATTFGAQLAAIESSGSSDSPQAQAAITAGVASAAPAPAAAAVAAPAAAPASQSAATSGSIDESLVPQFGVVAGTNPDGTGNCAGANGVAVPCSCPPDRQTFINDLIQNVNAGAAVNNSAVTGVTFPSGTDVASAQARFNAATITLQNLEGAGVGCPQAATTFGAQLAAIESSGSSDSPQAQAAITAGVASKRRL